MKVLNAACIRAISFDVTGTLLVHRYAIAQTYSDCATWARLPDPPSADELKPAFKRAYRETCLERPCFGHAEGKGSRDWWEGCVRLALQYTGREVGEAEFERYFTRVYQHYGSLEGYEALAEVVPTLEALRRRGIVLGITSNTPRRTTDTVLPMLGLHDYFSWFASAHDVGCEKPHAAIFERSVERASFWVDGAPLQPHEVLHVGDGLESDFCGARRAGLQALFVDRSADARATKYQDWLDAPEYPGKSEADIQRCTITSLAQILELLDA